MTDLAHPASRGGQRRVFARPPGFARSSSSLKISRPPNASELDTHHERARSRSGIHASSRRTGYVQTLSALLWLPQAGVIAWCVGGIAAGAALIDALMPAALVLGIGVLRTALDGWAGRLAFRGARAELSLLRSDAVAALAGRSPLDRERPASGLAASILAEQAEAIVPFLARFQPARLKATIVPLVIVLVVLAFSWVAALTLLIAGPIIPVFMALIGWRAKAASEAQMVEIGGMNAFLLDRLRGLTTIRALGAVDLTAARLRAHAEDLRKRTMAVLRVAFLSSAVLELFAALGVAMVAVYVGFHLLGQLSFGAWSGRLSLAEGLFVLLIAPAFFEPLRDLSAVWHDRASGEAALAALEGLRTTGVGLPGADASPAGNAQDVSQGGPSVAVEKLAFGHAGAGRQMIFGATFAVAPNERVALTGRSGAGKSTLLALIAGLVAPEEGEIVIGGRALNADNAADLRARMAWIGQRPHIFAGSLSANITLGRAGLTPADVDEALAVAALSDVAGAHGSLPLGEGGIGLSGGEALRLALARAAVDPTVDLILVDEPTAHLDAGTAAVVTEGLLALAEGRTLIVATHDPRLMARMDRCIDVDALVAEALA
ncbi:MULTISPECIES: thiol reductant ABC exporter subunit CydD [unclassified Chelatococcus]|uniref:thiol reductant ABC exporter subunit CydD n=1 Tax=unclassified Chelatococcus TaxID=2638111 RepID=UPI001BCDF5B9|nr:MULTISPECIES: thiol reductant ABC exporter subunit CydD [unclassified Chelatococcus]MBS7698341.1 thiol reductant ABC exporter subunit CydD [Chelatococcus sp. YT9]MBX3559198.1 thiol reductant ABC exporter subunit CydD [Chelatococcus sp.]